MYAIHEGVTKINGVPVETFEREVLTGDTALRVKAGTTGYKGGTGRNKGGRTYLCLDVMTGDFYFHPVTDEDGTITGIEIATCGDDSLNAIMTALSFAQQAISDQSCEVEF